MTASGLIRVVWSI